MNNFRYKKLDFLIFVLIFLVSVKTFAQQNSISDTRIIKLDEAIQLGIQNNNQLKIANLATQLI